MNTSTKIDQQILQDYVLIWVEQFLKAKKSENKTKGTIKFYKDNLKVFTDFLDTQEIKLISQLTPNVIRDFLLILEERGHNAGGIHGFFRAVKAFLRWYWEEEEPDYPNPINKVKAPRVPVEAIEGVSLEQFEKLLDECGKGFLGERDKAILKVLLDTGVRAEELCNIKLDDVNFIDNSIIIQQGKGRKPSITTQGW
jgi:integrase/recombinase XerD